MQAPNPANLNAAHPDQLSCLQELQEHSEREALLRRSEYNSNPYNFLRYRDEICLTTSLLKPAIGKALRP